MTICLIALFLFYYLFHSSAPMFVTDPAQRRAEGQAVFAAWKRAMQSDPLDAIRTATYSLNAAGCTENGYPMDEVVCWAQSVIPRLQAMLLEDYGSRRRNAATFRGGSLGSIWCDLHLSAHGKTKKTRVALTGVGDADAITGFRIMLDPTFDETW